MIKTEVKGEHVLFGTSPNDRALDALRKASPTSEFIFEQMDNLNEEVKESVEAYGEKVKTLPDKAPVSRPSGRELKKEPIRERKQVRAAPVAKTLEEELAELEERTVEDEEEVEMEEPHPEDIHGQILAILNEIPEAPSAAKIKKWKSIHGDNSIYCIGFGKGDAYVFTHLKRGQWQAVQAMIGKLQKSSSAENMDVEEELKMKVVQYCVLWPEVLPIEFFKNSRAGVVDALYNAILLNSYFLSPQQTMLLTTQL